jgi:ribosomal protein S18 acetylase RimI-like enzyme
VQGGEVSDEPDLIVTLTGLPVAYTNTVHRARLEPATARERIDGVARLLRDRGVPGMWWVGPRSRPGNLPELLEAQGFVREEDMPWMAADLDRPRSVSLPASVRAYRVDSPEREAQWLEAMTAGFAMGDQEQDTMRRLGAVVGFAEDAPWQRFVAVEGGDVVASSGVMFGGGVAGIYNVSTRPWARGRGIGAAMSSMAMDRAKELGYRIAVLGSQPKAIPIYVRLGFHHVARMGVFVFSARTNEHG